MFKKVINWFRSKNVLTEAAYTAQSKIEAMEEACRLAYEHKQMMLNNHLFFLKCLILQNGEDISLSPELQMLAGKCTDQPFIETLENGTLELQLKTVEELVEMENEPEFLED